jgi:hypothetical protein
MLRLPQHHFAVTRAERQRAQKFAIKTAQPPTQRAVAERDFRLLDRSRKHDVETDHFGVTAKNCGENLSDLRAPGYRRRACEWRRAIGFFVERDNDRRRLLRLVHAAEHAPAQHGEHVDRQTTEPIERRRQDQGARHKRDAENGNRIPKPSRYPGHARRRLVPRLQAGQAADERRVAWLSVGIDFENDFLVGEFSPIDSAGSERHA